jgi:putative transport protein
VLITITTLISAVLTCGGLALAIGIAPALASGLLSGALTSTPALAASLEVLGSPSVAVGYGAAYPFGVLGVILFVQLVPRLFKMDLETEAEKAESATRLPPVQFAWFQLKNSQLFGKNVSVLSSALPSNTLISRVAKEDGTRPALSNIVLENGDHLRVVGSERALNRVELLLGPREAGFQEAPSGVTSITLVVSAAAVVGRSLAELSLREKFSINVSRIWRDDFEFVPHGDTTLEFGDTIRVVGNLCDCQRLAPVVGHQEERLQETPFLPLTIGLLVGVLLGFVSLPLPGGLSVSLGLAGGPLLAGLVAGHFGRLGRLTFRVPIAAKIFIRELGLIFFLAGAGVSAGHEFWPVLQQQGVALIGAGVLTTLVPMTIAFTMARLVLRWDAITALGAICGAMTSTPGLGVVVKLSRSQASSLAYVAVYPTALIGITVLAPLMGVLLVRLVSLSG